MIEKRINKNYRIQEIKPHRQYDKSENWLQEYISLNPSILPLADLEGIELKVKFLCREFENIDILFVDDRGLLNLVEVKRGADNRSKREVVAQILDYASQISNYQPDDLIVDLVNKKINNNELIQIEANNDYQIQYNKYLEIFKKIHELINENHLKGQELIELFAEKIWVTKDSDFIKSWSEKFSLLLKNGCFRLIIVIDKASKDLLELTNYLNSILSRGIQFVVVELSPDDIYNPIDYCPHLLGTSGFLDPIYYREEKLKSNKKWDKVRFIASIENEDLKNEYESLIAKLDESDEYGYSFGAGKISGCLIITARGDDLNVKNFHLLFVLSKWIYIYLDQIKKIVDVEKNQAELKDIFKREFEIEPYKEHYTIGIVLKDKVPNSSTIFKFIGVLHDYLIKNSKIKNI